MHAQLWGSQSASCLLPALQAESIKKDLVGRLRRQVHEAHKAGAAPEPRWFQLKSPEALTPGTVEGTEQRYR